MLGEIQQVLRWVMLLEERTERPRLTAGGLLVLLWTEPGDSPQSVNCAVAAAGPWYSGFQRKVLQPVLTDLKESMSACTWSSPEADPEELCAFTDMHGSLRLLLSFQMKDARVFGPEWCAQTEAFLHSFSLANARVGKVSTPRIQPCVFKLVASYLILNFSSFLQIQIHFKYKVNQQSLQSDFRPPACVKKGCWCHGGHPVLGGRLALSIPPKAMDRGLFGELTVQLVTVLSPCVHQYPNLATQLTDIQLLVCGPSNVPFTGTFPLLQNFPAHLDCEDLSLLGLHCSSLKVNRGDALNTTERGNGEGPGQEWSHPTMQQSLLLCLFLQHSDPFSHQLADRMTTEVLIEHHLEDILSNNRQAVTTALQTELRNSLKSQHRRKKDQEKLRSAAQVILSSVVGIVICSSNMDFRKACLNSMKVGDTHELSTSLCESLRRVTSWKFTPKSKCYSTQIEDHPCTDQCTRTEI
ncbi:type 2 DNA topoisomerase 6 subunit B-like isoform 2-T2 [Spinachia spinachia]